MAAESGARAVLVTGASTGIGEACALHLDRLGVRVFAGVRNDVDGKALADRASERLTPVQLDVTRAETIQSARSALEAAVGQAGLAGLVNNAGLWCGGPLEFTCLDDIRAEFEVNVFGAIAVTQALLPLLRAARGRVVNVSSISGRVALPFFGPYAASKFALEAASDSLRVELRPWGMHVALVEPGDVETPIQQKAIETLRRAREAYPPEAFALYGEVFGLAEQRQRRGAPVSRVSKAIEHALFAASPKTRYLLGLDARALSGLNRLPTRLRDWLISRALPKYGRREVES